MSEEFIVREEEIYPFNDIFYDLAVTAFQVGYETDYDDDYNPFNIVDEFTNIDKAENYAKFLNETAKVIYDPETKRYGVEYTITYKEWQSQGNDIEKTTSSINRS